MDESERIANRSDLDRTQKRARFGQAGRQDGDGQTGTRAILATGRLTDVCLASEVNEWVSRADLWSNAVLASGEAVLLRRPGRLTSHLAC